MNSQCDQLPDGLAQLVEHCTGIVEVMGSNPLQALISQLLKQLNYLSCKLKTQIHGPTASHQYTE